MDFEQKLRQAICDAALALHKSGLGFAVFKNTKCNEQYWHRTSNGGFRLNAGANPADAMRDIYTNGRKYATECATAMVIVYYKALLDVYGDELFNRTFNSIYLMDWDIRDPLLSKVGRMETVSKLLPGDRAYFANPDHAPDTPQWQGENVIVFGDGTYYGHGIGHANADYIINSLNARRKIGSKQSAYLMDKAGRPDFKKLADVMSAGRVMTVWKEFPAAVAVMAVEGRNGTVHQPGGRMFV